MSLGNMSPGAACAILCFNRSSSSKIAQMSNITFLVEDSTIDWSVVGTTINDKLSVAVFIVLVQPDVLSLVEHVSIIVHGSTVAVRVSGVSSQFTVGGLATMNNSQDNNLQDTMHGTSRRNRRQCCWEMPSAGC